MTDLARAPSRSGGRPPPEGPRFSLRFDERGGILALARPFPFAFGILESLELGLDELRFPLDLSAGPARFRTRRTRVRQASVRLELDALIDAAVEEPFGLRTLAPSERGMGFALRDAFGTVAFDAEARFEGATLRIAAHGARAVLDAPVPPLARLVLAARALGLSLEASRGAIALPRCLGAVLRDALVPHGWRIPDDASCRLTLEWLGPRRARLRTLADDEPDPAVDVDRWEAVTRLAPVVARLADGDEAGARAAFEALEERGLSVAVAARAATLGLGPHEGGSDPLGAVLAFRAALRDGAAERVAILAEALADVEPCDAVAVESLCLAADQIAPTSPRICAGLLERAAARRPSDPRIALRLIEALARLRLEPELARALEQALSTREPGRDRGELARDAAAVCELAGHRTQADRLFRLAATHLPGDPRVLEGAAAAHERTGALDEALDGFDRAAGGFEREERPDDEARALRRAAAVAERAGRIEAAETRWTRASRVRPRADVFAAMARVRLALGREEAATRAEDRLLERVAELAEPGPEVVEAVAAGARRALEEGRVARARAWLAALRRIDESHPAVAPLSESVERIDAAALRDEPARLLGVEPERLVEVLGGADDPARLLAAAARAASEPGSASDLLGRAASLTDGDLASALADVAAELAEQAAARRPEEASAEPLVTEADAGLADWEELRERGRPVEAALALARAGAAKRDTAMLRAALSAAERAGNKEAALTIVGLALGVVGDGPARAALERVQDRLREE